MATLLPWMRVMYLQSALNPGLRQYIWPQRNVADEQSPDMVPGYMPESADDVYPDYSARARNAAAWLFQDEPKQAQQSDYIEKAVQDLIKAFLKRSE